MGTHQPFLTPDEAALLLRLNKRQLLGLPIRRIRLGHRTIRYRRNDIEGYLAKVGGKKSH